jgi:hypothetical protein
MARSHRKLLERELREMLKRQDREKLQAIRERIKEAKQRKRAAMLRVRESCQRARVQVRERGKERRARALAEARAALELEKQAAAETCRMKRARVRRQAGEAIERMALELEQEKTFQQQIERASRRKRPGLAKAVQRRESDDEVRANLPAELVPVFDSVAKRIRGNARKSRTEAFLEWAEENPGEVLTIQQDQADRDVAELIAQEQAQWRTMRSPRRYRRSAEALAADLSEVPF